MASKRQQPQRGQVDERALTVGSSVERALISPFMTATTQVLEFPLDPKDGFVYWMPGGKWGLARPALDTIKDAAGIMITRSEPAPGVPVLPHDVTWQVAGFREHVDGFKQEGIGTYRLDLTLPDGAFDPDNVDANSGGGRYHELLAGYYEDALLEQMKKKGIKYDGGQDKALLFLKMEEEMGADWVRQQLTAAHVRAVREVRRMRPHIMRRAETGAELALIRNMLGVQHAYTMQQLQAGIRITRAQRNLDALDKLPPQLREQVLTALALQAFDIRTDTFMALSQPRRVEQLPEPAEADDLTIDQDMEEPAEPEPETPEETVEPQDTAEDQEVMEALAFIMKGIKEAANDNWAPGGQVQAKVQFVLSKRAIQWSSREFPMNFGTIKEKLGLEVEQPA